jgi:hypothetical protein
MSDKPAIVPDYQITERLNYYYMLHAQKKKIHQNSFAEIITWLFSYKNIAIKAIVAIFLISFFLFRPQLTNSPTQIVSDSIYSTSFSVDTNLVKSDTCR